jgi:hypothetical protein
MKQVTIALLFALFSPTTTASESVWERMVKTDEMTDEVSVWICSQVPDGQEPQWEGIHSVMCAVCKSDRRSGYIFFSKDVRLAGDAEYRLIPEFSSDDVNVYPAKIRSPEGMDDIEVFTRFLNELDTVHFVDWANVQTHALSAEQSGKELLLQLEHSNKGFHIWKYDMTGLSNHLAEECDARGI